MNRIRMISDYLEQLKHRREVRYTITLLAVILSALVQSYVLQVFARPSGIISGGFTGLAMLVERLGELRAYHIPMQVTMLLLNIPVAVLCCKGISLRFTAFSLVQVALCSLFLQVFTFRPIFNDEVLNVIFGGVIWGASIVIALRGNASTGGTDFIALYISNRTGMSIWTWVFFGNAVMYCIYGSVFGWKYAGYSIHFHPHDRRVPSPVRSGDASDHHGERPGGDRRLHSPFSPRHLLRGGLRRIQQKEDVSAQHRALILRIHGRDSPDPSCG